MQLRFYANVALKYEMLHYRFTPSSRLKTIIDTFPRVYCKNFGRGWGINWNYRQPFPRLLYCQSKFQITFRRTWIIILRYRRFIMLTGEFLPKNKASKPRNGLINAKIVIRSWLLEISKLILGTGLIKRSDRRATNPN